ncbi:MAG: hypothetical protein HZC24_15150 [Rhodocyclales bacterium]|nr:hypothetical protein [Rhodocyclales bacterium]
MSIESRLAVAAAGVMLSASAGAEPAASDADFAPPPVPAFMLKRPEKPLTLEEMRRQADEAAARARRGAPAAQAPSDGPTVPEAPRRIDAPQ